MCKSLNVVLVYLSGPCAISECCYVKVVSSHRSLNMTKKRKRQDDFQKVKLKVGKRKPKADNATDVNFRTKGIRLTEQLKKDGTGPTTHRHLNIKVPLLQVM